MTYPLTASMPHPPTATHPATTCAQGEYANADNNQDDVSVIATKLGWAADDHGNDFATATPIALSGAPRKARLGLRNAPCLLHSPCVFIALYKACTA
jgi:hypothetical protein